MFFPRPVVQEDFFNVLPTMSWLACALGSRSKQFIKMAIIYQVKNAVRRLSTKCPNGSHKQ